jgi:flagellar motor switch protein FliM
MMGKKEPPKIVEGVGKVFSYSGETLDGGATIHAYDFSNPSFLSDKEINQVRARNEKFAFYLGQALSLELRMNMDFAVKNLAVLNYSEYTQSISSPSHVSLFKIKEISGVGILEMGTVLALAMVDRSLGGRGTAVKEPRLLTAIESTMVDDLAQVIVNEWTHQWEDYIKLTGTVIGQETTGRFLQTSAPDSAILVLTLEATLGEVKEELRIGIPYYSITPILLQITELTRNAEKTASHRQDPVSWRSSYNDISVKAHSEWNIRKTTVKDVLELQPGDFLQLPSSILKQTYLRIAGKDCFVGEFGKNEDGVAIQISKKLTK